MARGADVLRPDERTRCDRCRNYDGARCRAAPPYASSPSMVAYWPLVAADGWCASFFLDRGKWPDPVAAEAGGGAGSGAADLTLQPGQVFRLP